MPAQKFKEVSSSAPHSVLSAPFYFSSPSSFAISEFVTSNLVMSPAQPPDNSSILFPNSFEAAASPPLPTSSTSLYECCVCLLPCSKDNDQLRQHILQHLRVFRRRQTKCPICLVDCFSREMMEEHFLVTHGGIQILVCEVENCCRTFWSQKNLERHKKNHEAMQL